MNSLQANDANQTPSLTPRGAVLLTLIGFVVTACLAQPAFAEKKRKRGKGKQVVTGTLDEGKLEQDWFGEPRAWAETEEIDYLWVKEGYDFSGKTLHFLPFPEPEELLVERDENDYRLARQMAQEIHRSFADTFNREYPNQLPSSLDSGEIRVEGRVVDCSTGNTAAKVFVGFGAGSGNTTIDLRFTDTASGEVVAALHHRVVSGTTWSTTDSKFFKWVKKMGKELSDGGWYAAYEDGKGVRE